MALGFDFEQLMANPMFQMGLGMLGQQRQWGDSAFSPVARGALQGFNNLQNIRQFQQDQQLRALQIADIERKREQAERHMKILQDASEAYKARAPKPRPLAFTPQLGDEQVSRNYQDTQIIGNMLGAGVDPSDIAAFSKIMNPKPEKSEAFTLGPGQLRYDASGKVIAENPREEKDLTDDDIREIEQLQQKIQTTAGATRKMWQDRLDMKRRHPPANVINMPSVGGIEIMQGEDGKPHRVAFQVGKDGTLRRIDLGPAVPAPKEKSVIDKLYEEALAPVPASAPAPPALAGGRTATGKIGKEETKVIDGVTYVKRGTQWFRR